MSATATQALYGSVPKKDFLGLFPNGEVDAKKVTQLLGLHKRDIASATGVSADSIRFDVRMPEEVHDRIQQWAVAISVVAEHFNGDAKKTTLWFTTPNHLLGNLTPRDMIRTGRFMKLWKFIQTARSENERPQ